MISLRCSPLQSFVSIKARPSMHHRSIKNEVETMLVLKFVVKFQCSPHTLCRRVSFLSWEKYGVSSFLSAKTVLLIYFNLTFVCVPSNLSGLFRPPCINTDFRFFFFLKFSIHFSWLVLSSKSISSNE